MLAKTSSGMRDMESQHYQGENMKPIPTAEPSQRKPGPRIYEPSVPRITPTPTPLPTINHGVLLIPRKSIDSTGVSATLPTANPAVSLLPWLERITPTINQEGNIPSITSGKAGLLNNGFTCYFNAVAQALLHCPAFINLILSHPWPTAPSVSAGLPAYTAFTDTFIEFALQYWSGRQTTHNPHNVLASLRKYNTFFTAYSQHDAHEALRSILSAIDDALTVPFRSAFNANELRRKNGAEPPANPLQRLLRPFDNSGVCLLPPFAPVRWVFEGSLETATVCKECGNTSRRCEQWQDVQLPLPSDEDAVAIRKERGEAEPARGFFGAIASLWRGQQALSLEMCLKAVCASSELSGNNRYFCDKCRRKVDATSRSTFSSLPPILTFQLQRFHANGTKSSRSVAFPMEGLDMAPYLAPARPSVDVRAAGKEDDLTDTLTDNTGSAAVVFGAPLAVEDVLAPTNAPSSTLLRPGHVAPPPDMTNAVADTVRTHAPREWARALTNGVHGLPLSEAVKPRPKPAQSTVYDLVSLVRHSGSAVDGHYIAFVKHQLDGRWYICDDSSVRPVAAKDVESSEAYLLFYQRRGAGMEAFAPSPGARTSTRAGGVDSDVMSRSGATPVSTGGSNVDSSSVIDPRVASAPSPIAAAATSAPNTLLCADTLLQLLALERDAVAARADKSKCMLVSAAWIARVAATRTAAPVDNRDLYCAHSRVLQLRQGITTHSGVPARLLDAALVSREGYMALMRTIGGGPHVSLYDAARFLRYHRVKPTAVIGSDLFPRLQRVWGLREGDITAILSPEHPYAPLQPLLPREGEVEGEDAPFNGHVSAGVCAECTDAYRRQFEMERIGQLDRQARLAPPDSPYLIIPHSWLFAWRAYVRQNGARPGPIDNSVLLTPDGQPREGLTASTHYCGLHAEVFHGLLGLYGGGPVIVRKTMDIYDMHPLDDVYDPNTGLMRG